LPQNCGCDDILQPLNRLGKDRANSSHGSLLFFLVEIL